MKIYNSMTRQKEEFKPINPGKVTIYVCGPTVYDYFHIGNARPYVVFDTVRRYFEYKGFEVTYVQNFTDVDDKIINRANKEGVSFFDVANRFIKEAFADADSMNVRRATVHPLVTEEMNEIIAMIETIINNGFAYEVDGSVFFDTVKFSRYGKLSKKNIDELNMGVRIEVDGKKKNPSDFVLWKPAKPGEPKWQSPWSMGRPGWHIECSAMAKKYLGDTIDIHAGGSDLLFPHHENEIAQSECANGCTLANYWMHNGFINIDNEKMSKSQGNFFTTRDIAKEYSYELIRFFILSAHYRSPVNFSRELIEASENALDRIQNCLLNLTHYTKNNETENLTQEENALAEYFTEAENAFVKAMDDDFNTADAITAIFEAVKFINTNVNEKSSRAFAIMAKEKVMALCKVLGITERKKNTAVDVAWIEEMIAERQKAKAERDFKKADEIRQQLLLKNIVLEDTRAGVRWKEK